MAERDANGRFKKGHKGGARKGSPNKAKQDFTKMVERLVFGDWNRALKDWGEMEPKDRMRLRADLIKYILPARKAVDSTVNIENLSEEQLDRIIEEILTKQGLNG